MPVNNTDNVTAGAPFPRDEHDAKDPDVRDDDDLTHPVMISQEQPIFPENFDELTPEEQQVIRDRYKFLGIRLRADLKDETVPVSNDTLDV